MYAPTKEDAILQTFFWGWDYWFCSAFEQHSVIVLQDGNAKRCRSAGIAAVVIGGNNNYCGSNHKKR